MRILVADDDIIVRKLIRSALTRDGHEVEDFEDGQALWEAYDATPAPMIVTDWMMPRASGVDVVKRIRRQKSVDYPHVVLVTSLSPMEHTVEAYRAGVDDFVGKPFGPDEISERVAAAARGALARSEASLRSALEITQNALGPEHAALLEPLDALARVARQQRSFARCRSFIRRQLAIAVQAFGTSDPRSTKLARELEELSSVEDTWC
jgi:DNA-binding response OmpR family regulator